MNNGLRIFFIGMGIYLLSIFGYLTFKILLDIEVITESGSVAKIMTVILSSGFIISVLVVFIGACILVIKEIFIDKEK